MALEKTKDPAFREFVGLLRKLHELIAAGKEDDEEADAVRDQMDPLWAKMAPRQQELAKALSGNLYLLSEDVQKLSMSREERRAYSEEAKKVFREFADGKVTSALAFLNKPAPENLPAWAVFFLLGRCWERLDELDLALLFMKKAEALESRHAVSVLHVLQRLGQHAEASRYASRIVEGTTSTLEEMYVGAGE